MFKRRREANPIVGKRKNYSMTIVFNNDHSQQYRFTNVPAGSSDEAVDKMKSYVAKNGWFGNMKHDAIVAKLSAVDIREVG